MRRIPLVWLTMVVASVSPVSLTGCAYGLHSFNYPETAVSGILTDSGGKPAQGRTISLVLARGRGYDLARQDAAKECLEEDSYAYMTLKAQTDDSGTFRATFPANTYKSCNRFILLPGFTFTYKHAGTNDILLLLAEDAPPAEWYAVLDRNGKTRTYALRKSDGRLIRLRKPVAASNIQATVHRDTDQYSVDIRMEAK